jgi:predicted transcriptional regulator
VAKLHSGLNCVLASLDEQNRRRMIGLLATKEGWGGIQQMSRITGMSRTTILRGCREIEQTDHSRRKRIRQCGGGRKVVEKNSLGSGKPSIV